MTMIISIDIPITNWYTEHTLNLIWTYPEHTLKIWQNLKNMNYWLTESPTDIQEMLAHLKTNTESCQFTTLVYNVLIIYFGLECVKISK